MKDQISALYSEYIIDGIRMDSTPAQMLSECQPEVSGQDSTLSGIPAGTVIDESADPVPCHPDRSSHDLAACIEEMARHAESQAFPAAFPGAFTRFRIASAVTDALWKEGHFRLENLETSIRWKWDSAPVGNMAAFYYSSEAASQYLFDLGVRLSGYSYEECPGETSFEVSEAALDRNACETCSSADLDEDGRASCKGTGCSMTGRRRCPDTGIPDPKSWIIYIPFDTCQPRLGGSKYTELFGSNGDTAPEIRDPDYFIDCFEVVRELVEDGIVISGATIREGGLAQAMSGLCLGFGISLDLSGIESSYVEKDLSRILFSEIPGAIIQIRDADYDYVDSQMLLQDIAYYPVGHPDPGTSGITVSATGRSDVFSILSALLQGQQSSEGED